MITKTMSFSSRALHAAIFSLAVSFTLIGTVAAEDNDLTGPFVATTLTDENAMDVIAQHKVIYTAHTTLPLSPNRPAGKNVEVTSRNCCSTAGHDPAVLQTWREECRRHPGGMSPSRPMNSHRACLKTMGDRKGGDLLAEMDILATKAKGKCEPTRCAIALRLVHSNIDCPAQMAWQK